jgi:hypothetical protein
VSDYAIELEHNYSAPKHRIYRKSIGELEELKRQLDACKTAGFIEEAHSPFGAGILFKK